MTNRKHPRVTTPVGTESRTKQSFRDESDINNIVAKYQSTGAIAHVNKHEPRYGYAPSQDFREALELIREGNEMFADLPSSTRKFFDNNVEQMLDWVQDPANADRIAADGSLSADLGDPLPGTPRPPPDGPDVPQRDENRSESLGSEATEQ